MGALAEKYGYGFNDDGEMFAVSDPNEVWVFEIMPVGPLWSPETGKPGAVWCAQRVPDDHVSRLPQRVPDRRDRPGQQGILPGLVQRHLLRRRAEALRPGERQALQLEAGLFPGRRQRLEHQRPPVAAVALLRPRRPVPENQPQHAQYGPALLGQAGQEAVRPGRHEPDPGQVLRHDLRPGPGHPRRPVPESQLLFRHPEDQRGQRRVHQPRPMPEPACRTPSAESSGWPSAPRTRPVTFRSTPG